MRLKKFICYKINKEYVVHEQMDLELTVINLQKGHYFIGKGAAIDIFPMLEESISIDCLVGKVRAIYNVPEAILREELTSLIERWLTIDLVSEVYDCSENTPQESAVAADLKPWSQPIFIAFDDMRDLLLLDPIHETKLDQKGWPVAK